MNKGQIKLAENAHLFDPPIKYEWDVYVEDGQKIAYVTLDNNMDIRYHIGWFLRNKNDSDETHIQKLLEFDFVHAFGHACEDPNYTHLHWAIYGNFKERYRGEINREENYY